jgi:hypothetical protein
MGRAIVILVQAFCTVDPHEGCYAFIDVALGALVTDFLCHAVLFISNFHGLFQDNGLKFYKFDSRKMVVWVMDTASRISISGT